MLEIVKTINGLRFSELMYVYNESNALNGSERYPDRTVEHQLLEAEQDFYLYLTSVFFRQTDSFYAIWEEDGRYQSALRLEPYADGYLLCALETAPDARRRGYAAKLISAVQTYLVQTGGSKIYAHVSKKNKPSLAVHRKCGFQIVHDHAVYSDGSVLRNSYTFLYHEKSET